MISEETNTCMLIPQKPDSEHDRELADANIDSNAPKSHDLGLEDSVVIALPSEDCYPFVRSRSEMKLLTKRSRLVYELEEYLPIDADDLAVGVLNHQSGALIIAADSSNVRDLVQDLNASESFVIAICPLVFLALCDLNHHHAVARYDSIVWASERGIDVLKLERRRPIDWRWVPSSRECIELVLDELFPNVDSITVLLIGQPLETLGDGGRFQVTHAEACQNRSAESECGRIVRGVSQPIVDLRDGPLECDSPWTPVKRPAICALIGMIIMQVSLLVALLVRGAQYRSKAGEYVAEQEAAFSQVFPDDKIPVGILTRLESERRRVAGTRGVANQSIPVLKSVIPITHKLLSSLPEQSDARYRFDRIELEPDRIALASGTAKSFADQEAVADQLRSGGLLLPPMSVEANSQGVTLRLENIQLSGNASGEYSK